MQLVVSDTGPINYLVLIGYVDVLPLLFQKIAMPLAVREELLDPNAPPLVREWIRAFPLGWKCANCPLILLLMIFSRPRERGT